VEKKKEVDSEDNYDRNPNSSWSRHFFGCSEDYKMSVS
jgi:hypothetical protein